MKQTIRSILIEFQERDLPKPIFRDISPPLHSQNLNKAWVLMGMRRSGKRGLPINRFTSVKSKEFPKTQIYILILKTIDYLALKFIIFKQFWISISNCIHTTSIIKTCFFVLTKFMSYRDGKNSFVGLLILRKCKYV